jgi:RNA polymerase sigma-70 factor (ECF subfamily)
MIVSENIRCVNRGSLTTMETPKDFEMKSADFAGPFVVAASGGDDCNTPQHCSDDELVDAAQKGVSSAFDELLTRYRNQLYRTVQRLALSADETEDVVQEATLRAFVNIGRFRKEARFSTWLIAIGVNAAICSRRKSSRVHWIYLDQTDETSCEGQTWELQDAHPTPEQECIDRELLEFVQCAMRKLPKPYHSVLQTRNADEVSMRSAARDLGITLAAFKGRLWRARSMLLKGLKRTRHNKPRGIRT